MTFPTVSEAGEWINMTTCGNKSHTIIRSIRRI
jgi:hypothetical protein